MKILINGVMCDEEAAVISAYDHGFLYGIGLFETFRTYQGRCFLLEDHMRRLKSGCDELGIAWECDIQHIERQIKDLLDINGLTDAYVRYTVSAGNGMIGLPVEDYNEPNTLIYMKELPQGGSRQSPTDSGRSLQRLQIRRNTPEGTSRLKSFHFMNNILAKRELQTYPWARLAEGLFLTEDDFLAEGIVSNLFFIKGKKVFTPALSTGILAGITRAHVLNLAVQCGFSIEEGLYLWEDLLEAEEVFMTNSIQEIFPIVKLYDKDGKMWSVGEGIVGSGTVQLIQAYRESTGG